MLHIINVFNIIIITLACIAQSHPIDTGAVIVACTADVAAHPGPAQVTDTLKVWHPTAVPKLTCMEAPGYGGIKSEMGSFTSLSV